MSTPPMPRTATREPAARDLRQSAHEESEAVAAATAAARLRAGIETTDPHGPLSRPYREALRRHGVTLHRTGGAPLVRQTFGFLCAARPERASRRFDLLADAWGDLMSKGGRP